MRFLVAECTGPRVANWLRASEHEVFSVYDEARGMTDDDVLAKAYSERWILITNVKDFGEKVYRLVQVPVPTRRIVERHLQASIW